MHGAPLRGTGTHWRRHWQLRAPGRLGARASVDGSARRGCHVLWSLRNNAHTAAPLRLAFKRPSFSLTEILLSLFKTCMPVLLNARPSQCLHHWRWVPRNEPVNLKLKSVAVVAWSNGGARRSGTTFSTHAHTMSTCAVVLSGRTMAKETTWGWP